MTEGTKSWLFGCHSIIHSFLVIQAWKVLYKIYPSLEQIICILLHDIGYCGKNYLTALTNADHAELGAKLCGLIYGKAAYSFSLGHSRSACLKHKIPISKLEPPDDYSWILAPRWWLRFTNIIEPQLNGEQWQDACKKNWEKGIDNRKAGFELAKEVWALKRLVKPITKREGKGGNT